MSLQRSAKFKLIRWPDQVLPKARRGGADWRGKLLEADDPREPLTDCWLYVFIRPREGPAAPTFSWLKEYEVDEQGRYREVDLGDAPGVRLIGAGGEPGLLARKPCAIGKRGAKAASGRRTLELDYAMGETSYEHIMLASQTRFSKKALEQCVEGPLEAPVMYLKELRVFANYVFTPVQQRRRAAADECDATEETPLVGVVDPDRMLFNLGEAYRGAQEALINATVPHDELAPEVRRTLVKEQREDAIAKAVLDLVDAQPGRFDVSQARLQKVRSQHSRRKRKIERLRRAAEERGEALAMWILSADLLAHQEALMKSGPPVDYTKTFGPAISGATQAPSVREALAKLIEDGKGFVSQFVQGFEVDAQAWFGVGRKANEAYFNLWSELAVLQVAVGEGSWLERCLGGVNNAVGKTVLESLRAQAKPVVPNADLAVVAGSVPKTRSVWQVRIRETLSDADLDAHRVSQLAKAVEVVNLAVSLHELLSAMKRGEADGWTVAGAVGSSLDLISVLGEPAVQSYVRRAVKEAGDDAARKVAKEAAEEVAERISGAFAVIGMVSGSIDAVLAMRASYQAYGVGDMSTAVGEGAVALGSAGIAVGSAIVAVGYLTSASGWLITGTVAGAPVGVVLGVGGAVVAGVGMLVSMLGRDAEIDIFVRHSLVGSSYGTSASSTTWSAGPLGSWEVQPERQVAALTNLVCSFDLTNHDPWTGEVLYGTLLEGAQFRVTFRYRIFSRGQLPAGNHHTTLVVDPRTKVARHDPKGGSTAPPRGAVDVRGGKRREDGRPYLTVELKLDNMSMEDTTFEVLLELPGGASVPSSGDPPKIPLKDPMAGMGGSGVRHHSQSDSSITH